MIACETDKSWLACAIDSEGSVFFRDNTSDLKFKSRERGRKVSVVVTNNNYEYITKAQNLLGSNKVSFNDRGGNRKRTYRTGIFGIEDCLNILNQILPYMIVKRDKVKHMIEHFNKRPRLKRCEVAKQKQSKRMMGHIVTQETRDKISKAHIGIKHHKRVDKGKK